MALNGLLHAGVSLRIKPGSSVAGVRSKALAAARPISSAGAAIWQTARLMQNDCRLIYVLSANGEE